MKAYRIGNLFTRTQADADATAKVADGDWDRIDIPTGQQELIDWVNELLREVGASGGGAASMGDRAASATAAFYADHIAELDANALARVVEAAVCRLGELGRPGCEALARRVSFPPIGESGSNAFYRGGAIINEVAAYSR